MTDHDDILTTALYAEIDRLTAQIKELSASRDEWKRIAEEAHKKIKEIMDET